MTGLPRSRATTPRVISGACTQRPVRHRLPACPLHVLRLATQDHARSGLPEVESKLPFVIFISAAWLSHTLCPRLKCMSAVQALSDRNRAALEKLQESARKASAYALVYLMAHVPCKQEKRLAWDNMTLAGQQAIAKKVDAWNTCGSRIKHSPVTCDMPQHCAMLY